MLRGNVLNRSLPCIHRCEHAYIHTYRYAYILDLEDNINIPY